ncbi:hypothetical protein JJB07_03320 [Tumebacillus sp. ITR2]|uniref:Uncharacterized protein n=1 Tax=Tumebacillus amylolyticus TaxID=2801339 RepID=A0ABS1J5V5_9BACL|nr:hypothetical protein [Tumebacillus amylolyticus]MBL0385671.1 hypothetical protein [Tumebacillus amylolyticus]
MKLANTLIALTLATSFALVGCGSTSTDTTKSATLAASTEDATSKIKTGVEKLSAVSSDLKKAIDAGDEAKIKETGPKLEDEWSAFEDEVKPKFADLYEEIEKSLNPAIAASKATPLDKATLAKLNDDLSATLKKLADKVK